jgi:hypothetical protein
MRFGEAFHNRMFFWWDWGLNAKLCAGKAGALHLVPHLQAILLWLIWRWRSPELFAWASLSHDPPDLSLPNSWNYRHKLPLPEHNSISKRNNFYLRKEIRNLCVCVCVCLKPGILVLFFFFSLESFFFPQVA